MTVSIRVEQLPDNQEISFASVVLYHCPTAQVAKRRDLLSGDYTLRCDCGLELVLRSGGSAVERIVRVAIGAEATALESSSYTCTPTTHAVLLAAA